MITLSTPWAIVLAVSLTWVGALLGAAAMGLVQINRESQAERAGDEEAA